MVEEIKRMKDQFIEHMEKLIDQRGIDRVDVKMLGEYADIIKDFAEAEEKCWKAEYYKTVTEEMQAGSGSYGYTPMRQTGMTGGRRGYSGSPANGGNMMGHTDPIEVVKEIMSTSDARRKSQLRDELSELIGM